MLLKCFNLQVRIILQELNFFFETLRICWKTVSMFNSGQQCQWRQKDTINSINRILSVNWYYISLKDLSSAIHLTTECCFKFMIVEYSISRWKRIPTPHVSRWKSMDYEFIWSISPLLPWFLMVDWIPSLFSPSETDLHKIDIFCMTCWPLTPVWVMMSLHHVAYQRLGNEKRKRLELIWTQSDYKGPSHDENAFLTFFWPWHFPQSLLKYYEAIIGYRQMYKSLWYKSENLGQSFLHQRIHNVYTNLHTHININVKVVFLLKLSFDWQSILGSTLSYKF